MPAQLIQNNYFTINYMNLPDHKRFAYLGGGSFYVCFRCNVLNVFYSML